MSTPATKTVMMLINGNVSDAKARAKRHSWQAIDKAAREECGLSSVHAAATAGYLKGRITWDAYCIATDTTQRSNIATPADELRPLECLRWVSRSAKILGPAGTSLYAISDQIMNRAQRIVADAEASGELPKL